MAVRAVVEFDRAINSRSCCIRVFEFAKSRLGEPIYWKRQPGCQSRVRGVLSRLARTISMGMGP